MSQERNKLADALANLSYLVEVLLKILDDPPDMG